MKALILSGGMGMRLRPLSHAMPKQLVPVANRPVLEHVVAGIRELGATDIGVVVGAGGDQIAAALGDGSRFGARITYLPQERPLGLAHCLIVARAFLGDDDFVVWLGDNMLLDGVAGLAAAFREHRPAAHIVVGKVADPRRFGVVDLDGAGAVRAITEKPRRPRSDLAVIGVYFFTAAVHEAVAAITPGERGELELTDALRWLVEHGRPVTAHQYDGHWQDTGRPDDVLAANRRVLAGLSRDVAGHVDEHSRLLGPVVVEPGARVLRSTLHGPVVVGAGSRVEDSRIGPDVSVGRGCTLLGARVADSILMDGAEVRAPHPLRGSLLGRGATVRPAPRAGAGHRFVLSDHADVGLEGPAAPAPEGDQRP
ncbi:glucose-1-phosphate thymidylyltransferase [Actinomadura darangshiensis]|uniref:Glucose-1-phosphate thymidylyltransferase n=1 Tax=Actinomadura darangshiensis TaxID=705336 RepID=A0A4R5BIK4_9ACTN|nr:glucose-1-phosphate thymidylyltransferase [Actinomadura darangshiensis]TDD86518.1 glucose-1-phosphate thymidylyltransferase [Actinomadura darangshiensis]